MDRRGWDGRMNESMCFTSLRVMKISWICVKNEIIMHKSSQSRRALFFLL